MMIPNVPFYPNSNDDTYCYQACLKMIFAYFEPEKVWTWKALEKFTAKIPGKWTWPMVGLMNAQQLGYTVHQITSFNYERFEAEGIKYIEKEYGPKAANQQRSHTDIPQAVKESKAFTVTGISTNRVATLEDIQSFIGQGFLCIADVNLKTLNGEKGINNHFVVIYGIDKENVYMNDPGLPPQEKRIVPVEKFIAAWAPNKTTATIKAFKK